LPASQDKILSLLDQPHLSEEDIRWLLEYVEEPDHDKELQLIVQERFLAKLQNGDDGHSQRAMQMLQHMHEQISNPEPAIAPVHRIHFLRTAWFRYAAAILIIIGVGSYLYLANQKEKPSVTQNNPNPVKNDVAPGGNRATLTLADGSKIVLDSAKSGQLAREANATITKTADGKIVYDADEKLGDRLLFNTMATPRGGQYQLTLPDGSQVWLNAESSITYPAAFNTNERKVSITGEAYFEVAKDKTKKFIVDVDGKASVEVLGTHFNVNAYREENVIATTLIEGAVRLSANAYTSTPPLGNAVHTPLILKPGQQGQLSDRGLSLAANPDLEQVMAWKNGMFLMTKMDLPTIMRQISRWYDVDFVFDATSNNRTFSGGISRNLPLSEILELLKASGVSFRLEGKTLHVRP
jgi:transmembrane sensor